MPSSPPEHQGTAAVGDRHPASWSLTRRLVLLVAVVSLTGSVLTAGALVRALGEANREQAQAALAGEADTLLALVDRPARAAVRLELVNRRSGWAADVVAPGGRPSRAPFSEMEPIPDAADDAAPFERTVAGTTWLVLAGPMEATPAGRADLGTVLVGRRLAPAVRLTPDQRRSAFLAGLLGLLGGAGAGFLLASSITGPLSALAASARRMSAGERNVPVPLQGPAEVTDVGAALDTLQCDLAAGEQRRRAFLLAVSHELRTPMTAVAGYAEALADRTLPAAEVPPAAAVIVTESARLQRRVEDLLALARLEAEDFRLDLGPTDVSAVLRAAAAALAPRAHAAAVRVSVQAPESGPVLVTDGERLRQIIDALADNAIKVLAAVGGGVLVLACRPSADGAVQVEVRDSGPGLAPEDLDVAFEPGLLSERYRGSRPVGSGVGLALVGELARRLGGQAQACPAAEGGVCFAVRLTEARTFP